VTQAPNLLVSDADRARVVEELQGHYETGRLTLEELQQRVDEAHSARTESQLENALRQLPPAKLPSIHLHDTRWRSLALQYVLVNVVAILVWLFSGAHGDFWPRWVLVVTLVSFGRRAFRPPRPPLPPRSR
jgi:Domain of unknown function (DUF1707)